MRAPVLAQDKTDEKSAETAQAAPWIVGDTAPVSGVVFEAWFDRSALKTADRPSKLRFGSPSAVTLWLRTSEQSCIEAEGTARTNSDSASEPATVFVCARATHPGKIVLVARLADETPFASQSIEVSGAYALGPVGAALLTTFLGFIAGVITSVVTGKMQASQEAGKVDRQAQQTIVSILSGEITANADLINRILAGTEPPQSLPTRAYNNLNDLGQVAWDFIKKNPVAHSRLNELYRTEMRAYNRAVRAWQLAGSPTGGATRDAVTTAATALQNAFRRH
jgi:hypothetical protein